MNGFFSKKFLGSIILLILFVVSGFWMFKNYRAKEFRYPSESVMREESGREAGIVHIQGEINAEKAMEFVYGNFNPASGVSSWELNSDDVKKVESVFKNKIGDLGYSWSADAVFSGFIGGDKKFVLVTEAVPPDYDCHPCAPVMGAAVFDKSADGRRWVLKVQNKAIAVMGGFGKGPVPEIVKIGPSREALLFRPSYTSQGISAESLQLFELRNIDKMLSLGESAGSNLGDCGYAGARSGCYDFVSSIDFIPGSNSEYFDLRITTRGTAPDETYEGIEPINRAKVYKFKDGNYQ